MGHLLGQALLQLDECRTLWGEPERVQLSNVHGAVACACVPTWSRCMCMTVSACHQNVMESIAQLKDTDHTRSYDNKIHPCTSQQLRIRLAEAVW